MFLEFCRYLVKHWIHLRTTNPLENTFATVRVWTKVTKALGSRAAGIAMAYKLQVHQATLARTNAVLPQSKATRMAPQHHISRQNHTTPDQEFPS